MIKTYEKTPEWVYYLMGRIPELNVAAKECLALKGVDKVELKQSTDAEDIYSADPDLPGYPETLVARIPHHKVSIKIHYIGGEEELPSAMWHQIGEHKIKPIGEYDSNLDPRWHDFEYVTDYDYYIIPESKDKIHFLIFYDLETQQHYVTYQTVYAPLVER